MSPLTASSGDSACLTTLIPSSGASLSWSALAPIATSSALTIQPVLAKLVLAVGRDGPAAIAGCGQRKGGQNEQETT